MEGPLVAGDFGHPGHPRPSWAASGTDKTTACGVGRRQLALFDISTSTSTSARSRRLRRHPAPRIPSGLRSKPETPAAPAGRGLRCARLPLVIPGRPKGPNPDPTTGRSLDQFSMMLNLFDRALEARRKPLPLVGRGRGGGRGARAIRSIRWQYRRCRLIFSQNSLTRSFAPPPQPLPTRGRGVASRLQHHDSRTRIPLCSPPQRQRGPPCPTSTPTPRANGRSG